MRRSARVPSTPSIVRPVLKNISPPKDPTPSASMWKEFQNSPELQRERFHKQVAEHVAELKEELEKHDAAVERSDDLDVVLSLLQLKFGMISENFTLQQALVDEDEEIDELFGVDIAARTRDASEIGLPPIAEAHVAAAVREWRAKVDDTPWAREMRVELDEEAELLARRDALRASIEAKKKQLEHVNKLKNEDRFYGCGTRNEAESLLTNELSRVSINDEMKEDEDFGSEDEDRPPSTVPPLEADKNAMEMESDQESDDFLESI